MNENWTEVEPSIRRREWKREDCMFYITQPDGDKYFYILASDDLGCEGTLEQATKLCDHLQWALDNRYKKIGLV